MDMIKEFFAIIRDYALCLFRGHKFMTMGNYRKCVRCGYLEVVELPKEGNK
jgi:hypothetical protein